MLVVYELPQYQGLQFGRRIRRQKMVSPSLRDVKQIFEGSTSNDIARCCFAQLDLLYVQVCRQGEFQLGKGSEALERVFSHVRHGAMPDVVAQCSYAQ